MYSLLAIEKLTTHTNKDVRKNAEGTIWNVSGLKPAELDVCNLSSDQLQHQQQHVMISYDWNHQKIAAAINLELKSLGYFTWMDIDRMSNKNVVKLNYSCQTRIQFRRLDT